MFNKERIGIDQQKKTSPTQTFSLDSKTLKGFDSKSFESKQGPTFQPI